MSMFGDLARNRDIFRKLAAGEPLSDLPVRQMDTVPESAQYHFEESGSLDGPAFALRVEEMERDNALRQWEKQASSKSPEAEPVRYTLNGPMPVLEGRGVGGMKPMKAVRTTVVDTTPLAPLERTELTVSAGTADTLPEREDLLEGLLRRLETSARRYPQDLTGKE